MQFRIYILPFINTLKIVLSQFKETYMLIMEYPYIRGEKNYQIILKSPHETFYMHT